MSSSRSMRNDGLVMYDGDKNDQPTTPVNSKRVLYGLIIAGSISVIITMGIVIAASRESGTLPLEGTESTTVVKPYSPDGELAEDEFSADFQPIELEAPPTGLATKCNDDEVHSNVAHPDHQSCVDACAKAECCNFPASLGPSLSCLQGNEEKCLQYKQECGHFLAPASVVESHVMGVGASPVLPAPPNDIKDLCDSTQLDSAHGIRACTQACLPAECCWSKTELNCAHGVRTFTKCQLYSPCLHLHAAAAHHSKIKAHVQRACSKHNVLTHTGHVECDKACTVGKCCFEESAATCPHNVTDFCHQYQPCHILWNASIVPQLPQVPVHAPVLPPSSISASNAHAVLPPLPGDMATACNPAQVADDATQCTNYCSLAACCNHPAQQSRSCLNHNHKGCHLFHQYCAALTQPDSDYGAFVPVVDRHRVDAACSADSLLSRTGLEDCAEYCLEAECCWNDATSNCNHLETCNDYAACSHFKAVLYQEEDSVKTHVDSVCTTEAMATKQGRALCETTCAQHLCCYQTNQTCHFSASPDPTIASAFARQVCAQYESCSLLNTVPSPVFSSLELPPPTDLATQCSNTADSTAQTVCHEQCSTDAAGGCCQFPINFAASCLLNSMNHCVEYHQACSAKLPAPTVPVALLDPHADLADVCSPASLATETGWRRCHKQCDYAACCWSNEAATTCATDAQCAKYTPCFNLKASATIHATLASELATTCTEEAIQSETGRAACHSLCIQHACCWEPEGIVLDIEQETTDDAPMDFDIYDDDNEFNIGDTEVSPNDDVTDLDTNRNIPECVENAAVCQQYDVCKILIV